MKTSGGMALFAIVAFGLFSIGCVSTSDTKEAWIGTAGAELVRKWEEPDRIIANEPEGRIYVYIKREENSSRSSDELYRYGSGTRESDIPGAAAAPARVYIFWLDSNDIVYDWTVQEEIPGERQ